MSKRARWWFIMAFPLAMLAIYGGVLAYALLRGDRLDPVERTRPPE